jgi:hypothetical protein
MTVDTIEARTPGDADAVVHNLPHDGPHDGYVS